MKTGKFVIIQKDMSFVGTIQTNKTNCYHEGMKEGHTIYSDGSQFKGRFNIFEECYGLQISTNGLKRAIDDSNGFSKEEIRLEQDDEFWKDVYINHK